jgi:cytochrome P460
MKILMFFLGVGVCISAAVWLSRPVMSENAVIDDHRNGSGIISGYKHWTRVNPEPQWISPPSAALCAAMLPAERGMSDQNPHLSKFVVVYVNDVGRSAMMEQRRPRFPEGSIVVKEKLSTRESTDPELLTVMRKRGAGYDPQNGDWEYMVFDGPGQTIQASGKLENCQACHLLKAKNDYVSRSYLPADVLLKLK